MKRKIRQPKIRPFKGATLAAVPVNDGDDLLDFIEGMGYILYEDPSDSDCVIISDKVLTYGWLKKNAKRFDLDVEWWQEMTDYDSRLNEELDSFCM